MFCIPDIWKIILILEIVVSQDQHQAHIQGRQDDTYEY